MNRKIDSRKTTITIIIIMVAVVEVSVVVVVVINEMATWVRKSCDKDVFKLEVAVTEAAMSLDLAKGLKRMTAVELLT